MIYLILLNCITAQDYENMLIYGLIQQQIASTVKWTLERLQTYSQVDIYENWG